MRKKQGAGQSLVCPSSVHLKNNFWIDKYIIGVFQKESKHAVYNGSFREKDCNTDNTGDRTFYLFV